MSRFAALYGEEYHSEFGQDFVSLVEYAPCEAMA